MTAVDTRPVHSPGVGTAPELQYDFDGHVDLTLEQPTPEGRTQFRLTSGRIDGDAESFFGRGYCHWLAGAIHCLTGWDLITYDRQQPDGGSWFPVHTAVVTPRGTVLDIFGEHPPEAVVQRYERDGQFTVRTRNIRNEDMPGDVVTDPDGVLRGDPLWWCRTHFADPKMTCVVVHFARALVRRHGYGRHLRVDSHRNDPRRRTTASAITTLTGGSVMTTIGDIRQAIALTNDKTQVVTAALQQATNGIEEITALLQVFDGTYDGEAQQVVETFLHLRRQISDALQATLPTQQVLDAYAARL